ncbi:hypothetical protein ACKKBF_B31780 [Auxenochlorella protothecoides x Auxenochlorella symbiontica]
MALPDDVLVHVFRNLSISDWACKVALVSKGWATLASQEAMALLPPCLQPLTRGPCFTHGGPGCTQCGIRLAHLLFCNSVLYNPSFRLDAQRVNQPRSLGGRSRSAWTCTLGFTSFNTGQVDGAPSSSSVTQLRCLSETFECVQEVDLQQALCRCGMDHADAGQVLDSGLGLQLRIRFAAAVQGGEAGSEEQLVPHSVATVCLAVDDGTCHRPVLNLKGSVDVWKVDALAWALASTEEGRPGAQDLSVAIPRLPRQTRRAVVILRASGAVAQGARCACFDRPRLLFSPACPRGSVHGGERGVLDSQ